MSELQAAKERYQAALTNMYQLAETLYSTKQELKAINPNLEKLSGAKLGQGYQQTAKREKIQYDRIQRQHKRSELEYKLAKVEYETALAEAGGKKVDGSEPL